MITIYTDGACSGNPGVGGWGVAIIQDNNPPIFLNGGKANTTNNQMELLAAIRALESLKRPCKVKLYTDSNYVKQGITEWIIKWKQNGFRNSKKKQVLNSDLWKQLDQLAAIHKVEWYWVKGHSGHPENERADALANKGVDEIIIEK